MEIKNILFLGMLSFTITTGTLLLYNKMQEMKSQMSLADLPVAEVIEK